MLHSAKKHDKWACKYTQYALEHSRYLNTVFRLVFICLYACLFYYLLQHFNVIFGIIRLCLPAILAGGRVSWFTRVIFGILP